MRDAIGWALFAPFLACVVMAAAFLVTSRRRPALVACLGAAALAAAAGVALLPAHYAVTLRPRDQVVAAPGAALVAVVHDRGRLGGTWTATYALDGRPAGRVAGAVRGGKRANVVVPLPDGLSAGRHTLRLGAASVTFTVLTPAHYRVGHMLLTPAVVRVRQRATVAVDVTNTGQASGPFAGGLLVNGRHADAEPVTLKRGESRLLTFPVREAKPGAYRLRVAAARGTLLVVRPVRPATGAVLVRRGGGGSGRLQFVNREHTDVMVALTDSPNDKRASVVFYVRSGGLCSIGDIGDGAHFVYFSSGRGWNRTTNDFIADVDHERFKNPISFRTTSWTASWVDWAAWTRYSQRHVQYTVWKVKVSDALVWGPAGGVVPVSSAKFPKS